MSVDLDQAFNSSLKIETSESLSNEATLQSFKPFPNEILPLIFKQLTAFQRCLVLSVCRDWSGILLGGRGFWQLVDLPLRLPISTAISILQIFNLRSGFSLKEVVFEPIIDDIKDIDRIFEELRKSSSNIRALVLPQVSTLNTQTRRYSRSILPCLQFLYSYDHRSDPFSISRMWAALLQWGGSQKGVANFDGSEMSGLRYYATVSLNRVKKEEKSWFKELQSLEVHFTRSLEDLHLILKASKSSLKELNICGWGKEWKDARDVDLPIISMDNSRGMDFHPPFDASAAKALSRFLKFQGQVRISGSLASVHCFEMKCLVELTVFLYDESENKWQRGPSMALDELKEKTDLFLETNSSLSRLTLIAPCPGSGSSFHLNYFLERLIGPSNSSAPQRHGSLNTTEEKESILVPKLKVIEIRDPSELDGTLLMKCLKSRKKIDRRFKIMIRINGNLVTEQNWKGQSWMK